MSYEPFYQSQGPSQNEVIGYINNTWICKQLNLSENTYEETEKLKNKYNKPNRQYHNITMFNAASIVILFVMSARGFMPLRTPFYVRNMAIKVSINESIPMPPTSEAIQELQTYGYTYLESLSALVSEKNNATNALSTLNGSKS